MLHSLGIGSVALPVLGVFGANLRLLTDNRGTVAEVARVLDISRVQFYRFLRSEAYPHPLQLHRICEYFRVDARILLEPLSELQIAQILSGHDARQADLSPMQEAIDKICPDQDFTGGQDRVPDGLYVAWRTSMAQKGKVVRRLEMISSLPNGMRILRGYDGANVWGTPVPKRSREYRALFLNQQFGFATIAFSGPPSNIVTVGYFDAMAGPVTRLTGVNMLCRGELSGRNRFARSFMEKVPDFPSALAIARGASMFSIDDVPDHIAELLAEPLEMDYRV